MYMNTNHILQSNQAHLIPPSQPFIRSQSDAANEQVVQSNVKQDTEGDSANGLRMKRYNSLPDVAEYLDPNLSTTTNNLPSILTNNFNNNSASQIDSLIAAFNQDHKRTYDKNTSYFDSNHPDSSHNSINVSQSHQNLLPHIITTNPNNNPVETSLPPGLSMPLSAGLSVPMSAGLSIPLSAGLSVPLSAGLTASSNEVLEALNLSQNHSSAPHSPSFNVENFSHTPADINHMNSNMNNVHSHSNQQYNNLHLEHGNLQQRRKKLMTEEVNQASHNMMSNMGYSQGYPMDPQLNYASQNNLNMRPISSMNLMGSSHISPISPHFPQQQQQSYQTYYQDALLLPNQLKRPRVEESMPQSMFTPHGYVDSQQGHLYNLNETMAMPITITTAPAPDAATAQAAQEAINAAAHTVPPTDDQDPEAVPRRQHLRYAGDLYTPQWVRYGGHKKEGYCDLCSPGKWLQLKNSAYWYHKQFYHGISSVSGKFFAGPVQTRQKDAEVIEGLCHQCQQWVQMSSAKRRNSVLWFRHAHKCHVYHKPKSVFGKRS